MEERRVENPTAVYFASIIAVYIVMVISCIGLYGLRIIPEFHQVFEWALIITVILFTSYLFFLWRVIVLAIIFFPVIFLSLAWYKKIRRTQVEIYQIRRKKEKQQAFVSRQRSCTSRWL